MAQEPGTGSFPTAGRREMQKCPSSELGTETPGALLAAAVLTPLPCLFDTGLLLSWFYLLEKFILEECYNTEINAYWGRHFLVTVLLHICAYISAGQGSDHAAKAEMWAELLEQNKGWMSCYVKHILTKDFFTLNPISPHFQMNSVIVCVHSNSKGCFTQLQL